MITLKQAKTLRYGDMIHSTNMTNCDGSPMRFTVKGMVKTWKRDPNRIRVPLKRGLYEYGCLTHNTFEGGGFTLDLHEVSLGSGI